MHLSLSRRPHRGFTLIELIVVILVLGLLAAIAVVGYTSVTDRAQRAAAEVDLRNFESAVVVHATVTAAPTLTRRLVLDALNESIGATIDDGLAASSTWTIGGKDDVPTARGQYAVAFDPGNGSPSDAGGQVAVVTTSTGTQLLARTIVWGSSVAPTLPTGVAIPVPDGTTPGAVVSDPETYTPGGGSGVPQQPGMPAPTGVQVTPGPGSVEVVWNPVPGAVVYTVTATPEGGGIPVTVESATSPVTINGLAYGQGYAVAVVARSATLSGSAGTPPLPYYSPTSGWVHGDQIVHATMFDATNWWPLGTGDLAYEIVSAPPRGAAGMVRFRVAPTGTLVQWSERADVRLQTMPIGTGSGWSGPVRFGDVMEFQVWEGWTSLQGESSAGDPVEHITWFAAP